MKKPTFEEINELRNRADKGGSLITHLHILTSYSLGMKNGESVFYSYEEGLKMLLKWNIIHELETKIRLEKLKETNSFSYLHLSKLCENCGHPRGWHFRDKKCCDKNCDCNQHKILK